MSSFEQWQRSKLPQGLMLRPPVVGAGEIVGNTLQAAGQFGQEYAQTMQANKDRQEAIIERARAKQDQRDQQDATKKVLDFDASYDARFADLQQQAAPGAEGFVDTVKADFDKQSAEFLKTVAPSALPYAQEQMARSWGLTQGAAIKFSATSRVQLDRKTAGDIINTGAAILVTNPGKLDFVRDNVITSIKAMNLAPQDEAATLADVDAGLSTASLGGLVQRNPRAALAAIDGGHWNQIGADKLLQLRGQAESKARADDAMARAEADRRQALAQGDLLGRLDIALPAMAATGVVPVGNDGQPLVDPNEIAALVPGRRGEALQRQFVTAQQEGQFRNEAMSTSLPDDYARLASLAPVPGQSFSAEQQSLYQSFATVVAAKDKMLTEDPAAWVAGSPAIQQAWATRDSLAAAPNADPKLVAQATSAAVNATIEAQVSAGAAPWQARPLTKAQASGIVGQMKTANPDGLKSLAQEVVSYGPAAVSQVIAAGAPTAFAAMTAVDDPLVVQQLAQSVYRKPEEITNILSSTGIARSKVEDAVQSRLAPLFATMPAESRALYMQSFTDLAIDSLGRGAANETVAAEAATKSLLAGYNFTGRLRVPADLDLQTVKAGLASSMSNLLDGKAGIEVIPPPGFDGLGALQEAARHGGLQWFMNESGDGAILATPEGRWIPIVNRTSQNKATMGRFEVKFSDAARTGVVKPWWAPK